MTSFFKQSWFAPVASAATNFLFPSLGSAVGGAANSLLNGALSDGVANALGSAVVGGGIGALSNGGQGALTGALAGGVTRGLMDYTGYNQGIAGLLGNGSFSAPAAGAAGAGGGLRDANIAATNGVTGGNAAAAAAKEAPNAAGGALGLFGNGKGGVSPAVIAGLALAGGLGSSMMGANRAQAQPQTVGPTDPNQTRGLSQVAFNRTYRGGPEGDVRQYGMQGGQHRYYDNNAVPVAAAEGGYITERPMRGEQAEYERAHALLRQAEAARQPPVRETPAMRAIRHMRSQQAVEAGERTGYADGGRVRSERLQAEQARRAFDAEGRPMSIVEWMLRPKNERDAYDRSLARKDAARESYRQTGGYPDIQSTYKPYARGGVAGPGAGRDDAIPAVLSDGEYVIDAETVALLGDGSSKAGAQKLDQMRMQIRKHKGGALSRGQISPDAKPAIAYAMKGR